jgi:hypothetical protein
LTNATAVTATLDIEGDPVLAASLHGKDDAAAENLDAFVKTWFETGKQMYADMKNEMAANLPMGLGDAAVTLADQVIAGISIEKKGTDVAVAVKRPGALKNLPEQLKPAFDAAREENKRLRKLNSLRMAGQAMMVHESIYAAYPTQAIYADDGTPLLSWRVKILPFIDERGLYEKFKLDEPWDSPHNIQLLNEMPSWFSSEPDGKDGKTRVLVFTGEGAPFGGTKGITRDQITDGTSRTIVLVEAGPDKAVPWTKPEDLPFDPDNPLEALGKISEAGIPAVFFDGHCVMVPPNAKALKQMITHAGGEVVNDIEQ